MPQLLTQPPLVLQDLGNPVPQILTFPCHDCWPNPIGLPQFLARSYSGVRRAKGQEDETKVSTGAPLQIDK
jgi:hypothetical protein